MEKEFDDNAPLYEGVRGNENKNVNHPGHYTWLKEVAGIEVIDITRHMSFDLGSALKYILRAGRKHEKGMTDEAKRIEDLKKARWYLDDEIGRLLRER